MPGTWGSISDLREAQADDWFERAKNETQKWLADLGYTRQKPEPALSISLPTAEEFHASAPWRDLDPPKPAAQRPDVTMTEGRTALPPGAEIGPADQTGRVGSAPMAPEPRVGGDLRAYARAQAQRYGVDPDIFERQITQESSWNPQAVSPAGAKGLGQFMPGTAAEYGLTNPFDPYASLAAAAQHMADNLKRNGGDYRLALAAYNAGQGNVDKYGEGVFDDDFARGQTRDYVNIILGPGSARRAAPNAAGSGAPAASSSQPPAAQAPTQPAAAGGEDEIVIRNPVNDARLRIPRRRLSDFPSWVVESTPAASVSRHPDMQTMPDTPATTSGMGLEPIPVAPNGPPLSGPDDPRLQRLSALDEARAQASGGQDVMLRQTTGAPVPMPGSVDAQATGGIRHLGEGEQDPWSGGLGEQPAGGYLGAPAWYPSDERDPGEQPYDVTDDEGADRTNDPLFGEPTPTPPRMGGLDTEGVLYRQPLSQRPELPPEQPYDPDQGPREAIPGSVGASNLGPSQATAEEEAGYASQQPVPVEMVDGRTTPAGLAYNPRQQSGEFEVRQLPVADSGERFIDQSVPSPPGWQAIVDAAGNVVDWIQAAPGKFYEDVAAPVVRRIAPRTGVVQGISELAERDFKPAPPREEDRPFMEQARAVTEPVMRPIQQTVSNAATATEQAMGAPPGTIKQAAEDVSNFFPGVAAVRPARFAGDIPPFRLGGLPDEMMPNVVPPHVADELDFPIRVPDDPATIRAIEAVGGRVDPEKGVDLYVTRAQSPSGAGQTATRGGVFYEAVPEGGRSSFVGGDDPKNVGGSQVIPRTPTRFRSPLILSDAPGEMRGFNAAMEQLEARTVPLGTEAEIAAAQARVDTARAAWQQARNAGGWTPFGELPPERLAEIELGEASAALARLQGGEPIMAYQIDAGIRQARRAGPEGSPERAQALKDLVSRYGGDPDLVDDLLKIRGADASESAWAIKENILAANARKQGYDGVVTVQPRDPEWTEIQYHPKMVAAEKKVAEANDAEQAAWVELNRRYQAGQEGGTPEYDAAYQQYERATERTRAALREAQAAEQQVREELRTGQITELVDVREGRNPTPPSPTAEMKAAYKRVKDAQAAHQAALAKNGYRESAWMTPLRTEVQEAEAALDALMNEAESLPSGYTLRADVRRRELPAEPANVSAGALPASRSTGPLGAVNRALSETLAGGTAGAVVEQARNPDEDPRTAAARGFAVGAAGFPVATRLARGAARMAGVGADAGGGALSTFGAVPNQPNPQIARVAQQALNQPGTIPPGAPVNPRRLAGAIRRAQQGVGQAANPVPGLPAPPPNTPPSWWDRVQAWRYSVGLFGQLSTAMLQGGGGFVEVGLGAPTEIIRQAVLRGHPEHVPLIIGEALKSVPAGVASAGRTVKGDVPQTILNSSDYRPPVSARETSRGAKAAMNVVEAPGRIATQAPDAFWYEVFYRTGIAQAAAEEAQKTTSRLNPLASMQEQARLIANPTPEVIKRAHEFAQSSTYKGDLGAVGQLGEMVVKGPSKEMLRGAPANVQKVGAVYREIMSHFMPVYHTIARIHEGALEYTPGVGALPLNRMGLSATGRGADTKIAQQIVGMGYVAGLLAYAAQGGIRGPGHPDPDVNAEMRDMGRENDTINIGGYWLPIAALGKLGPIVNTIGAINDAMIYGTGKESFAEMGENDPYLSKRIGLLVKNFGRAFSDYPTANAFASLAKIGNDPVAAISELVGSTAAQYSPAAIRAGAMAADPKVRRPDRADDASPVELASDAFKQRSGIGRQSLPPAQDRLGREVENPRAGWAAVFPRVGRDKADPVIQAFVDNNVEIPRKREKLTIDGLEIKLTPPLQRKWQTYMGEYLLTEVPKTLQSNFWSRPTTTIGDRGDELRDLVQEATEDATERLEGEIPNLTQLLREAERKEAQRRGESVPAGR